VTDLALPDWWVEPDSPGEYGIENLITRQVDELHVGGLQEAVYQLQMTREAVPVLVARLRAHEAAGTATAQLRMLVAKEQTARYRVVHRSVGKWREVR
jgi:hypothetical protein